MSETGMIELVGIFVTAIISVLSLLVGLYQFKKSLDKDHVINQFNDIPPPTQHEIHINIQTYKMDAVNLDTDKVHNVGRKKIATDFLLQVLDAWSEPCMEFSKAMEYCIANCDSNCDECNIIYNKVVTMINAGLASQLDSKIALRNIPIEDKEAYDIFREKYCEWNEFRVEKLRRKASQITKENSVYKTCAQKSNRILELVDDFLFDTVVDAKFTILKLNGELNNKTYKGINL